jgi:hypothetical protein
MSAPVICLPRVDGPVAWPLRCRCWSKARIFDRGVPSELIGQ